MPRKTKEQNEEKEVKKQTKQGTKVELEKTKTLKSKATTKAKSTTKKTSVSKVSKEEITKKTSSKKIASKSTTKTAKKASSSKSNTKKSTALSRTTKKSKKVIPPTNVEYYDLPLEYGQTIVKILYQNPTTLFVYWEISKQDIAHYKELYGENFFEITRPVLIVYNDTMHYHFEIGINDFANSWYFHINDSNCDYRVALIRKPISYNENLTKEYVYISSSNGIETPNDKILFSTDEPNTVYFRNTKNNNQIKVDLSKLLKKSNLSNGDFAFPIVKNVYDLYKLIYNIDNLGEFSIDLTNPSSGNPSSHSLSSRFK